MKRLLWTILFVSVLLVLVVPTVYFLTAAKLPALDSEFTLERELRLIIEGERIAFKNGRLDGDTIDATFKRPEFSTLPKDLVAFFITDLGCPTFFQTPREEGLTWSWRVLMATLFGSELSGTGRCELTLARRLADRIGADTTLQRYVAAHKIHDFLQKDQLVAYQLETQVYEKGVIGVRAASQALYERPLEALSLGRMAELTLALPTNGVFDDLRRCHNPSRLRQWRNELIGNLAGVGLIAPERAEEAFEEPISCAEPEARR